MSLARYGVVGGPNGRLNQQLLQERVLRNQLSRSVDPLQGSTLNGLGGSSEPMGGYLSDAGPLGGGLFGLDAINREDYLNSPHYGGLLIGGNDELRYPSGGLVIGGNKRSKRGGNIFDTIRDKIDSLPKLIETKSRDVLLDIQKHEPLSEKQRKLLEKLEAKYPSGGVVIGGGIFDSIKGLLGKIPQTFLRYIARQITGGAMTHHQGRDIIQRVGHHILMGGSAKTPYLINNFPPDFGPEQLEDYLTKHKGYLVTEDLIKDDVRNVEKKYDSGYVKKLIKDILYDQKDARSMAKKERSLLQKQVNKLERERKAKELKEVKKMQRKSLVNKQRELRKFVKEDQKMKAKLAREMIKNSKRGNKKKLSEWQVYLQELWPNYKKGEQNRLGSSYNGVVVRRQFLRDASSSYAREQERGPGEHYVEEEDEKEPGEEDEDEDEDDIPLSELVRRRRKPESASQRLLRQASERVSELDLPSLDDGGSILF